MIVYVRKFWLDYKDKETRRLGDKGTRGQGENKSYLTGFLTIC